MFDRQTVIVLGAGASANFGFPLGEELRDNLISGIDRVRREVETSEFPHLSSASDQNVNIFNKDSFRAMASYLNSPLAKQYLPSNAEPVQMVGSLLLFHDDLKSQTHDTVDRFILDNPKHRFLGKLLLSQQIMLGMYDWGEAQLRLKLFADREYSGRRNWYQQLTNLIRERAQNSLSLANNKLYVVTFNYDHSLEQALETSLGNTEIHQGADYTNSVSIFHVNGTLSKLPAVVTDVGKFILECAQNFHLVEESVNSKVQEDRAKARSAISNAERIFLMGFNFDPSNVSAIGLQEAPHKERMFCLNYDGNLGLKQRIMQLGIPESRISTGSRDAPLHIDQALENGFLEQ